jgi:tripartite-type tricarboxylate transporter receptor subunit TctC
MSYCAPARILGTALAVFAGISGVRAETWPAKPIRLISPFVPGGGASLVARLVAPDLTEALGQSIVVDNRGGAGGVIGTEIAAHARPDGYTLVMGTASTISVRPLVDKVPFDPLKDLAPIIHTTTVPLVLCVHPSVPAKSVREFIALGRTREAKLNFASSGEGTISHLAGELFKMSSGVQMAHVPYKGGGQAIIDVIAGHVQVGFINILEASSQIKAERLRALAVTTAERSPVLPNVPTVAESGLAGYEVTQWSGMLAPAGTPANIIARLNAEVDKILRKPLMQERLTADGAQPGGGSPEKFAAFIKTDIAKWAKVVKTVGLAK